MMSFRRVLRSPRLPIMAFSAFVAVGAGWLALNISVFVRGWAFAMPGTTDSSLAPATFPRLILSIACLIAILCFLSEMVSPSKPQSVDTPEAGTRAVTPLMVLGLLSFCVSYLLLMPRLGFTTTSILALALGAILVGWRKWIPLAVVALLLPPATWFAFRYGMRVILPQFSLW